MKRKLKILFFGQRVKGTKIDMKPKTKTFSTVRPDKQPTFNEWAVYIHKTVNQ